MYSVQLQARFLLQRRVLSLFSVIRHKHYSILYVTGDRAHKMTSVLTPYIDFKRRLQYLDILEKNVALRGIKLDVKKLCQQWGLLQNVITNKDSLEKKRIEIADAMKELRKTGKVNDIEKFKLKGKLVRDDLKILMKTLWSLEEDVVIKVLSLPNDLHPNTPSDQESVIYQFGDKPQNICSVNHIEIGRRTSILNYSSPLSYYLKGNAALFEFCVLQFCADRFSDNNFVQSSNADFVRSVVVEGCGMEYYNPVSTLILRDEMIKSDNHINQHLVGSASLVSFLAFHAKHVILNNLPIKYFAVGCQYNPTQSKIQQKGLFDVYQCSAVEIFIVTSGSFEEMMVEFNATVDIYKNIYKWLGYHFRIAYLPPQELKQWESLRASFQMYSSYLKEYMEVGHLSICDTYISKRLLIYHETGTTKQQNFVRIISGTVVSVPKLLGCVLEYEQSQSSFIVPSDMKNIIFPAE